MTRRQFVLRLLDSLLFILMMMIMMMTFAYVSAWNRLFFSFSTRKLKREGEEMLTARRTRRKNEEVENDDGDVFHLDDGVTKDYLKEKMEG